MNKRRWGSLGSLLDKPEGVDPRYRQLVTKKVHNSTQQEKE